MIICQFTLKSSWLFFFIVYLAPQECQTECCATSECDTGQYCTDGGSCQSETECCTGASPIDACPLTAYCEGCSHVEHNYDLELACSNLEVLYINYASYGFPSGDCNPGATCDFPESTALVQMECQVKKKTQNIFSRWFNSG